MISNHGDKTQASPSLFHILYGLKLHRPCTCRQPTKVCPPKDSTSLLSTHKLMSQFHLKDSVNDISSGAESDADGYNSFRSEPYILPFQWLLGLSCTPPPPFSSCLSLRYTKIFFALRKSTNLSCAVLGLNLLLNSVSAEREGDTQ